MTGSEESTQSRDGNREAMVRPGGKARHWPPLGEAAAVCLGMILFGLVSHQGLPWIAPGAAGLLSAAFCIQRSIVSMRDIPSFFGLSGSWRVLIISVAGCAVGVGLGAYYRFSFGMTLLPGPALQPFTFTVGALFGLSRELSRSIYPAVAAHAAFDLMVHGAAAQAPWWVWA